MTNRARKKLEDLADRVKRDAQDHWNSGYTHYMLSIDGQQNTAYLIQWVESVGWHLDHAGWVWAQKGYAGYGGFGVLDSGVIGNFLFGRPGATPSVPRASDVPDRTDAAT
jgi:hypothetical protein